MTDFESEREVIEGPLTKRKFTDIFCCLIWFAFWILIAVIAIISYTKGDLSRVAQPYDSDGFPCGKAEREEFNYLFIQNPISSKYNENMVCVKECPQSKDEYVECYPNTDIKHCSDLKPYKTYGFASRLCIPTSDLTVESVKERINIGYFAEVVEDIKDAWPIFLMILVISLIFCFVWYYLVQCCAGFMITIMLLGSLAALISFGVFNWLHYKELIENSTAEVDVKNAESYKNTAIVFWVLAGVFLLLILCLISRIKLAVKMIRAAADFITDEKIVLFAPILFSFMTFAFIIWWIITFAFTFSNGTLRYDEGDIFGDMVWNDQQKAFVYIMIFALLWAVSFNLSANMFVVATMTAGWYFGRYEGWGIGLCKALGWAYTYHVGSLAFGSFLIALLWFIQLILNYIYQKTKEIDEDNFMIKCAMYFVACFERFMRFLNKHAFIEVVLRNMSYCGAAAKCVEVLTTNFLRFAVLSGLVDLFLFLGTIMITISITMFGYLLLQVYGSTYNVVFETIGPLVVS